MRWLPEDIAQAAAARLITGQRLAQEAVGLDMLLEDPTWASVDEVGPAAPVRTGSLRPADLPSGERALVCDDAGLEHSPESEAEWSTWVDVIHTRNYALEDPLLDWLDRFGGVHGHVPDTRLPGYDERTDFARFAKSKAVTVSAEKARSGGYYHSRRCPSSTRMLEMLTTNRGTRPKLRSPRRCANSRFCPE